MADLEKDFPGLLDGLSEEQRAEMEQGLGDLVLLEAMRIGGAELVQEVAQELGREAGADGKD